MRITLRLLRGLDTRRRHELAAELGRLDEPIGGVTTGTDLVALNTVRAPQTSWAVLIGERPVGVFAIAPYPRRPGAFQTSTYLLPTARGTGVNSMLKRAVVAAGQAERLPLYASIRYGNERSRRAYLKLFRHCGLQLLPGLDDPGERRWEIDLATAVLRDPAVDPLLTRSIRLGIMRMSGTRARLGEPSAVPALSETP